MNKASIGQAELELLLFIADTGPVTVRQACESFGAPRGYVRTTVLKMVERLYKKGFLGREAGDPGLLYRSVKSRKELEQTVVDDFVTGTLKGSVAPLVAFLANSGEVSEADLDQLRKLVDDLENERKGRKK